MSFINDYPDVTPDRFDFDLIERYEKALESYDDETYQFGLAQKKGAGSFGNRFVSGSIYTKGGVLGIITRRPERPSDRPYHEIYEVAVRPKDNWTTIHLD